MTVKTHVSTTQSKLAVWEHARQGAVYGLDDIILTNSRSSSTGAISCSALLSVTVGDRTAQKQVDFKVETTTNGICPFQSARFCFEVRKGHRLRILCSLSLFVPFQTMIC